MVTVGLTSWVPENHIHSKLGVSYNPPNVSPQPGVTDPEAHTAALPETHSEQDPHQLPDFDESNSQSPRRPILYLPPLLSKLPPGFSHPPPELLGAYRPLATETHLPDIDPASLQLHKALHHFHPVTDEYAETPYESAFNWDELVLPADAEREWYVVVFQSKRKEGSDGGREYIEPIQKLFT